MNDQAIIDTTELKLNELPEDPMERIAYAKEILRKYPLRHLDTANPAFPMSKSEAGYNLWVCGRGLSRLFANSYGHGSISPAQAFDGSKYFSCSMIDSRSMRVISKIRGDHLTARSSHFLHDCLRYLSLIAYVKFGNRAPELVPLNGEGLSNWSLTDEVDERKLATMHTLLSEFLFIAEDELGLTPDFDGFLHHSALLFSDFSCL